MGSTQPQERHYQGKVSLRVLLIRLPLLKEALLFPALGWKSNLLARALQKVRLWGASPLESNALSGLRGYGMVREILQP